MWTIEMIHDTRQLFASWKFCAIENVCDGEAERRERTSESKIT